MLREVITMSIYDECGYSHDEIISNEMVNRKISKHDLANVIKDQMEGRKEHRVVRAEAAYYNEDADIMFDDAVDAVFQTVWFL